MRTLLRLMVPALLTWCCANGAEERINLAGRILGAEPVVTAPLLFNSAEADAVVSALQIFPVDNPWNEDISRRPVLPNSDAMIAQITSDLSTNRRTLRAFFEMNFVLVPDDQPLVPIDLFNYPEESDPGPYPIPSQLPIEGWPRETGALTLEQWQRDVNNVGGDRHAIIVQPGTGYFWETWLTKRVGTNWQASNGARFHLRTNALRPATWTSADAAGLPMFPALVRYDAVERGEIEHALRLVVRRTRAEFIYPARHYASVPYTTNPDVPAMGQRLRLKAGFVIPDVWTRQEKAVLHALKKYGALVADNGNFFSISITPDDRWPANAFSRLATIGTTNFEVIATTGPNEGPRSPGAPRVNAGADRTVPAGLPVELTGAATYSEASPAIRWTIYSGPGPVAFEDATRTNTKAVFSSTGDYTLMLSGDDGVHAVAYDAVVFTVVEPVILNISRQDAQVDLQWTGGDAPYVIERTDTLSVLEWEPLATNLTPELSVPMAAPSAFFRVRTQ